LTQHVQTVISSYLSLPFNHLVIGYGAFIIIFIQMLISPVYPFCCNGMLSHFRLWGEKV